uniref:Si:ch73-379j16.2 n=1 Tax=Hippocampus comes TaxID=109280 RepID=A0A3Q2YZR5_HIPCM
MVVALIVSQESWAELRYSVPEEVKEGTVVGNVAKDLGLDKYSLVDRQFRVVSGTKETFFQVRPDSGALVVRRKIDREALCEGSAACAMELKILVENPLEMHHVVVEITDVNDHSPSFSDEEQVFEIAEHLSPGTRFHPNDEEKIPFMHFLLVTAVDGGKPQKSNSKPGTITNDYPLNFYLSENNIAGQSVFSVSATDKDVNVNAAISYNIIRAGVENDVTSFLHINSENGQITALKSFDFETLKSFQFQVVATDGGSPPLSSNVTVKVFILDQNDNAPVILYPVSSNSSAEGVEEIPRNLKAGDLVTKVRAYDADIGYNGWLLFSLQQVSDHSLFSLDRYTGQIRTLRSFTETDEAEHRLLILVKDNGNVSLSATATVTIRLVEPKEQVFEIAEHTLPGRRFQLHTARDPDAGTNSIRTYTLTQNDHFEVNIRQSDVGKVPFLVLKKSLDREHKDKHSLLVTAVDGGKPPLSGTLNVSIVVLDSNDNRPIFSQEIYEITITENIETGTSIFRVNATDPDEGSNGEIDYILSKTLSRDIYDIVEMDKGTGEIYVKGKIDFEEKDVYELEIDASDKGTPPLTGECRIIIKIKDVNDNTPQIEVTSLSKKVSEDSKPDPDEGSNGEIDYILSKTLSRDIYDIVE